MRPSTIRQSGEEELQDLQSSIGCIFGAITAETGGWRLAAFRAAVSEFATTLYGLLGSKSVPVSKRRLLAITQACGVAMIAAEQRDLFLRTLDNLEATTGQIDREDIEQLAADVQRTLLDSKSRIDDVVAELLAEIDDTADSESVGD